MIMWLSETNTGTIILDITTILLLAGMIIFTSLYRKRGNLGDRVFFLLLIADIITAALDGMNFFFEKSPFAFKGALITAGDTLFTILYEIMPFMMVLYLDYRLRGDKRHTTGLIRIAVWPCVLSVLLILGNLIWKYLFYFDEAEGVYVYAKGYDLINIAVVIYLCIILVQLWKKDKRTMIMYLIAIGCRIVLRNIIRDISSTPFIVAVLLIFFHILEMNESFYKEVDG